MGIDTTLNELAKAAYAAGSDDPLWQIWWQRLVAAMTRVSPLDQTTKASIKSSRRNLQQPGAMGATAMVLHAPQRRGLATAPGPATSSRHFRADR